MTRHLEMKMPPLLATALCGWAMHEIDQRSPDTIFVALRHPWLAAAVAVIGLLVVVAGVVAFRRHRTSVNPLRSDGVSALVVGGIYRHTRNPMYVGMVLWLAAWALWLGNAAASIVVPMLWYWLDVYQVAPEERLLQARFGADFDDYCRRVRRWI